MFFSFFFKYLFSSRSGSLIRPISIVSILALTASVASLIVVISVMTGFGVSLRDRLLKEEPHLVILNQDQRQNAWPSSQDSHIFLLEKVKKTLQSNPQVVSIRAFETQDLIARSSSGLFTGAIGKGYFKKDLKMIKALNQKQDKLMDISSNMEWDDSSPFEADLVEKNKKIQVRPQIFNQKKVWIGFDVAHQLEIIEGDKISLMAAENLLLPPSEIPPYEEVIADSIIYSPSSSDYSRNIFYEINSLPSLVQTTSLSQGVEIFLNHPENDLHIQEFLKEQGFQAQSWADRHSSRLFSLKLEKFIMFIFLCLAMMIAAFSISSMILLLITQKKKDIGILMVMGYSISKVRFLFIRISFFMSLIGVVGGLIVGYLICLFLQYSPIEFFPSVYYNRSFPVQMEASVFVIVFIIAGLLSYIASVLPVFFQSFSSCIDIIKKFS